MTHEETWRDRDRTENKAFQCVLYKTNGDNYPTWIGRPKDILKLESICQTHAVMLLTQPFVFSHFFSSWENFIQFHILRVKWKAYRKYLAFDNLPPLSAIVFPQNLKDMSFNHLSFIIHWIWRDFEDGNSIYFWLLNTFAKNHLYKNHSF